MTHEDQLNAHNEQGGGNQAEQPMAHDDRVMEINDQMDITQDNLGSLSKIGKEAFGGKAGVKKQAELIDKITIGVNETAEKAINKVLEFIPGKRKFEVNFSEREIDSASERLVLNRVDDLEEGLGQEILDLKSRLKNLNETTDKSLEVAEKHFSEAEVDNLRKKAKEEQGEIEALIQEKQEDLMNDNVVESVISNKEALDQNFNNFNEIHEDVVEYRKDLQVQERELTRDINSIREDEGVSGEIKDMLNEKLTSIQEDLEEIQERENSLKERLDELKSEKQEVDDLAERINRMGKTSKEIREEKQKAKQEAIDDLKVGEDEAVDVEETVDEEVAPEDEDESNEETPPAVDVEETVDEEVAPEDEDESNEETPPNDLEGDEKEGSVEQQEEIKITPEEVLNKLTLEADESKKFVFDNYFNVAFSVYDKVNDTTAELSQEEVIKRIKGFFEAERDMQSSAATKEAKALVERIVSSK